MGALEDKRRLRQTVAARTKAFCSNAEQARAASAAACDAVRPLAAFQSARLVLAYLPLGAEADCTALIAAAVENGARVALPRVTSAADGAMEFHLLDTAGAGGNTLPALLAKQTGAGAYGIREPLATLPRIAPETCDGAVFVIVPGAAFTAQGARLGRGKGFYDRYLARLMQAPRNDATITTCGFCFATQLVDAIPCAAHDVRMSIVATEAGICNTASA